MIDNSSGLFETIGAITRSALAAGALSPIATRSRLVIDRDVPIELRYVDALARKDVERAQGGGRPAHQQGAFNPFLPYDPALFVADIGADHVLILNKFPVLAHHVLLITRAFVDQEAIVAVGDFIAIAEMMNIRDGVVFFNGGKTGGGSQPHRHFQWMPEALPIEPALPKSGISRPQSLSVLPFRHAFIHLQFDPHADVAVSGAHLFDNFQQCCAAAGVTASGGKLSPYNLLITRRWMMVVPRTREFWEHEGHSISINALGFGGALLMRSPELIDAVERNGALNVLASVTQ
jgi:ATP adenylyltransferase